MLWPNGASMLEGQPFTVEKGKFLADRPLVWLIGEAFRVTRGPHRELRLSFLILEHDEDDILHPNYQYEPHPSLDSTVFLPGIVTLARNRGACWIRRSLPLSMACKRRGYRRRDSEPGFSDGYTGANPFATCV